jgi:hypothetical protein
MIALQQAPTVEETVPQLPEFDFNIDTANFNLNEFEVYIRSNEKRTTSLITFNDN